jgi:hypothetical protein
MRDIRRYLASESRGSTEPAFTKRTRYGLYVDGVGETPFMLSPYREGTGTRENECGLNPEVVQELLSLEELLSLNLPSPPALIEGLLHEGETVVIAGRQKVGKSRLTQQMALCLATGEPFLGMRVPNPVRVLMVDLENRPAPLSQRFKAMGGETAGRLHVWCAQSLDSTLPDASAEGADLLRRMVEQVRPDVLIIDPWRLWLDGDENDARDIVRGLKTLAGVRANLPSLAIVIVHHVRKEKFESPRKLLQDPSLWADAISGHHALMSHVDACFGLERLVDEEGNAVIVFGGIARNTEPQTLILEDEDSLRFKVAANEDAALKVMTKAEREVWDKIKGLRQFGFNQAVTAANTKNRKAVSATLRIAESHGLVRKEGDSYVRVRG